jgi:hypothetical protein
LIDPPPGHPPALQKLVSEALDILRGTGYRLDAQLTLAAKAVAQAEAITSAIVPDAEASDFARLGGAALEELVPAAIDRDVILKAARRQAIFAVGETAERLPSLRETALTWLEQIQKGQVPVRVDFADLDRPVNRFESVSRLTAVAIVIAGVLIGSAVAATVDTGDSSFRTNLTDTALLIYFVATAIASVLVVLLLWRLVRPERRGRRRDDLE